MITNRVICPKCGKIKLLHELAHHWACPGCGNNDIILQEPLACPDSADLLEGLTPSEAESIVNTDGFIHVTGQRGYRRLELEARKIVFLLQSDYCHGGGILCLMNSDVAVGALRSILRFLCRNKPELAIDAVHIETVRSFCEKTLNPLPQIYPYPYRVFGSTEVRNILLELLRKMEMLEHSNVYGWRILDHEIASRKKDASYLKSLAGIEPGTVYFEMISGIDLPAHYKELFRSYLDLQKQFGVYDLQDLAHLTNHSWCLGMPPEVYNYIILDGPELIQDYAKDFLSSLSRWSQNLALYYNCPPEAPACRPDEWKTHFPHMNEFVLRDSRQFSWVQQYFNAPIPEKRFNALIPDIGSPEEIMLERIAQNYQALYAAGKTGHEISQMLTDNAAKDDGDSASNEDGTSLPDAEADSPTETA